jgi:NAD(P)H-flavin reductase
MPPAPTARAFHPARVLGRVDVGGGLSRITIDAAPGLLASYTSPGQYVEVTIENESGFFVLANYPGAPNWQLIMRAGGGASDFLVATPPGRSMNVTRALGAGFPMDEARGTSLTIVLGGTGIAAGPPLLTRRVMQGDAARTQVFVGVRTRSELGLRREVEAWIQAGARVLVCLSNDEGPLDELPWTSGYVQDVLRARAASVSGDPVFAVGPEAMIGALRELAPQLGIAPERIHTNH